MQSFQKITSVVAPLPIQDVDTDMIIPAQYMTSTDSKGYGEHLFERLRTPDFILNKAKYRSAQILVARNNFGCGSSREHAVWAITQHGFKVIIAPSFADIFTGNSLKNGLVLVVLPEAAVEKILAEAEKQENYQLTVNLEEQTVALPDGEKLKFNFDPFRKECLIKGLDDLGYIQSHAEEIGKWENQRDQNSFYQTTKFNY